MTPLETRKIRTEELRRRVETLPKEVDEWRLSTLQQVDREVHASQLAAISELMKLFFEEQAASLNGLDPAAADFETRAFDLVLLIIKAQRAWDFFRDKLGLRLSPKFKEILWVADTAAWDCYSRALQEKANVIDVSSLREPPLTYLTAEFSPATFVRGQQPKDGKDRVLGTATLPIPVIELPWDHVENVWELTSLLHETGHDLEADLKLRAPLLQSLTDALNGAGIPEARVKRWSQWLAETFADLVAMQLGGPAFADSLFNLLLLPAKDVTTLNPKDPHPNHYVRILMNAAYIRTLHAGNAELDAHAQRLHDGWIAIYGANPAPALEGFADDFPVVFSALMDTKLAALNDHTAREIFPYTQDAQIRKAASYLVDEKNRPHNVRPRHWISASRLAVNLVADRADFPAALQDIHTRTMKMVRDSAPGGARSVTPKARLRKLAENYAASGGLAPE